MRSEAKKAYHREYMRRWYADPANKAAHIARVRRNDIVRAAKMEKWVLEQKRKPCTDCGQEFDPVCMDFDHLDGKTKSFNVSEFKRKSFRLLMEEVAKCELVCANCHRLRTKARRLAEPDLI